MNRTIDFSLFRNSNFGWAGLYKEERAFEESVRRGLITDFDVFIKQSVPIKSLLAERIKRLFNFDDGWAFWWAEKLLLKYRIAHGPQNIGNCVGYSAALCLCYLMLQEIVIQGQNEEFFHPFVPWLYGAGRVYQGNGGGWGDGSNGIWQVNACLENGVLPADLAGLPPGGPQCSSSIGRRWGSSRSTLDAWKDKAAPYKIRSATRCKDAEDVKKVITEFHYPVTHATNSWFHKSGYDSKYDLTLWRIGGRASHQTFTEGMFKIKGQWFAYVGNQWGNNYHGAPGRNFPLGGFVTPIEDYDRFIKSSACYAYQDFSGRTEQLNDFSIF